MGELLREYRSLLRGNLLVPSWMFAVLPVDAELPGITTIRNALRASDLDVCEALPAPDREVPDARWEMEALVREADERVIDYRIWLMPRPDVHGLHYALADLDPALRTAVIESRWWLGTSAFFEGELEADLGRQVDLCRQIAPEAVITLDHSAWRPRQGDDANLYEVHVAEEAAGSWVHTHGLLRCGLPELEIVGAQDKEEAGRLLILTARHFFGAGIPDPDIPFTVRNQELVWRPWQAVGGVERDAHHQRPGAVLLTRERRFFRTRYRSPA